MRGQSGMEMFGLLFIVAVGLAVVMFAYPIYNVWASSQAGQASLARAEYERQTAVVEAKAKDDSAVLLAEAEVNFEAFMQSKTGPVIP